MKSSRFSKGAFSHASTLGLWLLISTTLAHYSSFGDGGPIAAGDQHSVRAIDPVPATNPGTLWTWGNNRDGQLGTGNDVDLSEAIKISVVDPDTWVQVSAGKDHTVAIRDDGAGSRTLWGIGSNAQGQLGLGTGVASVNVPTQIGADTDWLAVCAGGFHTLALKDDNSLWAFGSDSSGQLGNGDVGGDGNPFETSFDPIAIEPSLTFKNIGAGDFHSAAVQSSGLLYTWGDNLHGKLGLGSPSPFFTVPTLAGSASNWDKVSAGGNHTLAVKTIGELWAAGRNIEGQLGTGPLLSDQSEFVQVGSDTDWDEVSAGSKHSLGLKTGNTLWAWGLNADGQLGDQSGLNQRNPVQIGAAANWVAVSAGRKHSLAANGLDEVFAAGDNGRGQLGSPLVTESDAFLQIVFDDSDPGDPRPDFLIENINIDNVSLQFSLGQTIGYTFDLVNNGANFIPTQAIPEIEISVELFNAASGPFVLVPVTFGTGLSGGDRVTLAGNILVGLGIPEEVFSVRYTADANGDVIEEDETNNVAVSPDEYSILRSPDFEILSAGPLATEKRPGELVQFTFSIGNLTAGAGDHPVDAPAVPIDIILTTNEVTGDGDDLDVGTILLDTGIAFGETLQLLESLTLPTVIPTDPVYFFAFIINPGDVIREGDFTNNTFLDNTQVFDFLPDLAIPAASVINASLRPGDALDYSVSLFNSGSQFEDNDAQIELNIVLTTDQEIGNGDDVAIGTIDI